MRNSPERGSEVFPVCLWGVQPSIGGRGRSASFPSLLPSREVVAHRVSSAAGRGRRSRPAAEAGGRSKFPRPSEAVGEPGASAHGSPLMARTVRKPAAASPRSLSPDHRSNGPGPDGPGSPLRTSPGEPGASAPGPSRQDRRGPRARRNRSRRTPDPSLGSASRRRRRRGWVGALSPGAGERRMWNCNAPLTGPPFRGCTRLWGGRREGVVQGSGQD